MRPFLFNKAANGGIFFPMAKVARIYKCSSCGATYPRWQGQCDQCESWNTIGEETSAPVHLKAARKASKAKALSVSRLDDASTQTPRTQTHMEEFDRVLGGGLVKGASILIGGDPGIGKSTFLLQVCGALAKQQKVLYISGEESAEQIKMRARRLGVADADMNLLISGHLESIIATINDEKPDLVVIDSIQTVASEDAETSLPGSISQIKVSAQALIHTARKCNCTMVLVGHVTKEGNIAGPRLLEHMVDTVLYFEGERSQNYRLLRSFKNRFGATNEIGVFEMGEAGLRQVLNPSELFLAERPEGSSGSVVMAGMTGTRPILVEIQALVNKSQLAQPRRTTLGVDPNRVAMITAVLDKHGGSYGLSSHDVFVNVTGGLKITEPASDLAIATALLSSLLNRPVNSDVIVFGELGLSGEIRSVSNMNQRIKEAEKLGFTTVIAPKSATKPKNSKIKLVNVKNIGQFSSTLRDEVF